MRELVLEMALGRKGAVMAELVRGPVQLIYLVVGDVIVYGGRMHTREDI
jgi:hypothetical protein